MELSKLISIALFTILAVFTVYGWIDRYRGSNAVINEAFGDHVISDDVLMKIIQTNEPVPTDIEATKAHQTLLRFIRNDFSKGIKFVEDFRERFYGVNVPFRKDLDLSTLMNNYNSPLQRA